MKLTISLSFALVVGAALAHAQGPPRSTSTDPLATTRAATVSIVIGTDGAGSGFIVEAAGIVVTAAHVIAGANAIAIQLPSGQRLTVQGILHVDETTDLAVLKLAATNLPFVALGGSDDLRVGQRLFAVGSPLGLEQTVSDGILSAERIHNGRKLLQVSIPVSPGSSGGPILNEAGRVVGIIVSGIRGGGAENLNFALPISYVREILPLVRGQAPRPIAGNTGSGSASARRVVQLAPDSPRHVNEHLEFQKLAGVEFFVINPLQTDWREAVTTRYVQTTDPQGRPTLERVSTHVVEARNNLFAPWVAQWRDDYREAIAADGSGRVESFYQRASFRQGVASFTQRFRLVDSLLTIERTGSDAITQIVPRGIVSMSALGGAIAAAPDSLRLFHVWVLTGDSTGVHPTPARVEVLSAGTVRVKVPSDGQGCASRGRMRDRDLPALRIRVTIGAVTDDGWIHAARPRVRLRSGDCVTFPGL